MWHFKRQNNLNYLKRRITILFLILICLYQVKASPQSPELLIIGHDTIPIFFIPLNELDSIRQKAFFDNIDKYNTKLGISFNLWRKYQGLWQIDNNKLYLVGIKDNPYSAEIIKATFQEKYSEGRVFADWFSSYLAVPKDRLLRWDGIFSRTYFKEEVFEFSNGNLTNTKIIENYIDLKNGISRLDDKVIIKKIFKKIRKLNWKELSDYGCDDEYFITIDENGKITNIEFIPLWSSQKENDEYQEEYKDCIPVFIEQLKDLQFDIITWNGKPYKEKIRFEIFYDKRLENWTR